MKKPRSATKRIVIGAVALTTTLLVTAAGIVRPSNERVWLPGQERLPYAHLTGSTAIIHNVRNFTWRTDETAAPRWEQRSYDLSALETAWFVLAPFSSERRGAAHTFLSFGFADSQYVAVSVEARREVGEDYSLVKGVLRRFEIMYVIGDERDLIGLRSNIRGDDVYLYPIRATREKIRALFVEILNEANHLNTNPAFYNTLTNNCTTNILKHANRISPGRIPYGKEVLLPGYSDALAQRLGLLDTTLPLAEARQQFLINERARAAADDADFSRRIRGN